MRTLLLIAVACFARVALAQFTPPSTPYGGNLTEASLKVDVLDAGVVNVQGQASVQGPLIANTNVQLGTGALANSGVSIAALSPSIIAIGTNGAAAWTIQGGNKDLVPSNAGSSVCQAGAAKCNVYADVLDQNGRLAPSAAPNDGGTPQVYIEYGRDVMSGGTKTVTFKNAFSVAPACFCQDGTAVAACDVPISTISTTQAVINGTTTDKFSWQCIGDR